MQYSIQKKHSGMILLIVIGCLVFTTIVFSSMINRVRHESGLTARNSINEDLYQLALAIGRLTVRKLSKEIQNKNVDQKDIYDAIFNGTPVKDKAYTSIDYLDVMAKLRTRYIDLKSEVTLSVEFDPQGFNTTSTTPGTTSIPDLTQPTLERKGSITVKVTVTAKKHKKSCKLIKQFFVVRLLPAPFHKFTLYCTYGADLKQSEVNRLQKFADDGKLSDADPPLVLFNRPIDLSKGEFDFTNLSSFRGNFKPKDLPQSGWVYLGGDGQSKISSSNPDKYLVLNICSGEKSGGTISQKYFGEAFHFFYEDGSKGWLGTPEWSTWMASTKPTLNGKMIMTFVDYGLYEDMFTNKTAFNGQPLFTYALEVYKTSSNPVFQGQVWDKTNALHLFGVPTAVTPTLVFGQVKRRYMRTFAFYFADISKVYPIRWDMAVRYWAPSAADSFYNKELLPYLTARGSSMANPPLNADVDDLLSKISYKNFGIPDTGNRSPIGPNFNQHESYMEALKNIASPDDPTKTVESLLPDVMSNYPKDKIGKKDFQFSNDKQLLYNGRIDSLANFPTNYLGPKISYFIKEPSKTLNIVSPTASNIEPPYQFLLDKQILSADPSGNRLIMYLDQIIKVEGDINIKYPIRVQRGGIIICDGKITLYEPIHSLFKADTSIKLNNDDYGLVTLIAKGGIVINSKSFKEKLPNEVYPEVHAIMISLNSGTGNIEVDGPVHIKGAVAIDRLDRPTGNNLLAKGGIIEWGFDPAEFVSGDPIDSKSYYGFAMGPRDYEIVESE
ncbi:MAG: hypothetical protein HQM10_05325 [Candidatus Riflebacteria bacterium]|nr:hypothetical protein [Candidatus Riflebacteria bacterium]